ncbi:MAG: hypothetical protein O4808_17295 [Trichodesmium sp. St17_bin3_1_1]|jgi:hypothetical protein|nr:hypothetical protein [Trichodesmium sp. St17_bin3_1_1]
MWISHKQKQKESVQNKIVLALLMSKLIVEKTEQLKVLKQK